MDICRFSCNLCAFQTRQISLSISLCKKTHYETLGVSKMATLKEIKQAYYKKAKIYHPDSQSDGSHDFLELKKAYDVLRRPADRRNYDNILAGIYTQRSYSRPHANDWYRHWDNYNFTKPFQDSAQARKEAEIRSWRNIFLFTLAGVTFIFIYNSIYWYRLARREREINTAMAKDEIARAFLRQRELKDKLEDSVQVDYFARLLRADIEEAQRRRNEERELSGIRNPKEIREVDRWMSVINAPDVSKQYKPREE